MKRPWLAAWAGLSLFWYAAAYVALARQLDYDAEGVGLGLALPSVVIGVVWSVRLSVRAILKDFSSNP